LKLERLTADLVPAVAGFNARLLKGGADPEMVFPETPAPESAAGVAREHPFEGRLEERFLLLDEGSVRGAFILQHQNFWLGAEAVPVAHLRLPLSEGIVDRKFAGVGMQLVRHALRQQPLLFALGMGGRQRALPKLLQAMQWRLWDVPFYFFVNRPARFLHGIRALRTSAWRRLALDLAAFSGVGWAGARMWDVARRKPAQEKGSIEVVRSFSQWADEMWEDCKRSYSMLAVRDSSTLNALYPDAAGRFHCRMVRRSGQPAGWFAALDTVMEKHKQFGNLRVGTIVDALARPQDAPLVIHAAADFLRTRGVDLVISNQMHPAWGAALRGAGFIGAPSNFALALSPELARHGGDGRGIHVNRGDGDGPIHL
jgi:hypothetical protein